MYFTANNKDVISEVRTRNHVEESVITSVTNHHVIYRREKQKATEISEKAY